MCSDFFLLGFDFLLLPSFFFPVSSLPLNYIFCSYYFLFSHLLLSCVTLCSPLLFCSVGFSFIVFCFFLCYDLSIRYFLFSISAYYYKMVRELFCSDSSYSLPSLVFIVNVCSFLLLDFDSFPRSPTFSSSVSLYFPRFSSFQLISSPFCSLVFYSALLCILSLFPILFFSSPFSFLLCSGLFVVFCSLFLCFIWFILFRFCPVPICYPSFLLNSNFLPSLLFSSFLFFPLSPLLFHSALLYTIHPLLFC